MKLSSNQLMLLFLGSCSYTKIIIVHTIHVKHSDMIFTFFFEYTKRVYFSNKRENDWRELEADFLR